MIPHIVEKLESAVLHYEPWPHIIIDDFLPTKDFDTLAHITVDTKDGYKPNDVCEEHQRIIDTRQSKQYSQWWQDWYSIFENNKVIDVVQKRFNNSGIFNNMRCDIHQCESGFILGEHNDQKFKTSSLISLQIYCTGNNDGVVLHRNKFSIGQESDKYIENKPNRAWLFCSGDRTYHSVPKTQAHRTSVLMKYIIHD